MQPIHRLKRWYSFNFGHGREMLQAGASPRRCPHCDGETPVYESDYDSAGDPVTFTVCLWCEGFIEFDGASFDPSGPYTISGGRRVHRRSE